MSELLNQVRIWMSSQARSQAWANPGSARVAQDTARVALPDDDFKNALYK